MKLFVRLAAVAAGALAMVGATVPTAGAITQIQATFVGRAQVIGGIGYPVVTLAPQVPGTTCLPLPGDIVTTNCHPVYDHPRPFTLRSDTCVDETANINKPGKAPAGVGPCTISASGTVTGHCGAIGGQVTGTYTDSKGLSYSFNVHLTGVGGSVVVTGHITKNSTGRTGKFLAELTAVPELSLPGGPSCTNKTQVNFTVVGEVTVVIPNT